MDKMDQDYVLAGNAVVVEGKEVSGAAAQPAVVAGTKQGHKCCGGCCDVRRAVVIVNILNIGLLLMGVVGMATVMGFTGEAADMQDDEVQEALEETMDALPTSGAMLGVWIGMTVLRLSCSVLGIYGAMKYQVWPVAVSMAAYGAECAMAILTLHLGGFVMAACFAYPHYYFIQEVRSGIMTPENYPNEEFSCCCV